MSTRRVALFVAVGRGPITAAACGLAGALLCRPSLAQPDAGPGDASRAVAATRPAASPYWLRVTADRVNLRCRADGNSLVVMRVARDSVLRAVDSRFGWHRIEPPAGLFSLVAARYIDQQSEERGVVAVSSGRLRVRVGSELAGVDPLRREVQTLLAAGTEVRIVGREGDWLRIVPPDGVYVYISDRYVEPVSAEVARRLRAAMGLDSRPTTRGARVVAGTPTSRPAAGRPAERPDLSGTWGQRLVMVETTLRAEQRKPLLEQSWGETLAGLRAIAAQRQEPQVARLAAEWIKRVERRVAHQVALRAARQIDDRRTRDDAHHRRELERIGRARRSPSGAAVFEARGELLPSLAVRVGSYGLRYRLQDPLSGRLEAYVEFPDEAGIDVKACLGKYVGVRGERRRDRVLGADLIRVTQITVLNPGRPATRPAREIP